MPRTLTEIRSLARSHTRTAINALVGVMKAKDATHAARVSAATAILDRGWGRPPQALESGDNGALELIHRIERVMSVLRIQTANGLGYAARHLPSPYIWSGTDQYRSGKYVRDGVYDPSVVDSQLGCAGLLLSMMALDPSIDFEKSTPSPRSPTRDRSNPPKPEPPSVTNPSKGSIGAFVASILAAIFKRK